MAKGPEYLALRNVRAGHGTPPVIEDADLSIAKGDRLCLIGRNGSGKSTLLAAIEGKLGLDKGERYVMAGLKLATLPQDPIAPESGTVLEYVIAGGAEEYRAESLIYAVGLMPNQEANKLSGGQIRRADLARALAQDPDLLLLDEPTNHLDLPAIQWLEEELSQFRGSLLIVSHDRAFLKRVTNGVIWLDRGSLRRLDAGFDKFDAWVDEIEATEEAERNRVENYIKQEERYKLRGVTARRKRNVRRLERLDSLRKEKREWRNNQTVGSIKTQTAATSGKRVAELENVDKCFGDLSITKDFSTRIMRGDRVGILGPNGAGKTTLVKMLIGEEKPDSGEIKLGMNLQTAWFDQQRAQLPLNSTPWDVIGEGSDQIQLGDNQRHVVGYLKDFLFNEQQIRGKISTLSGGEKNRLLLAKILTKPANLLVLDEPTNDLDMETLDLLEEMLADYDGTLIVVSHDREFLDRVVTQTIALEGNGVIREVAGGFSDYLREYGDTDKPVNKASKHKEPSEPSETPKPKKKASKLSYKDQRDLDMLPEKVDALNEEISTLEATLATPDLYSKDPLKFQTTADMLDKKKAELQEAEDRWLELEMLQEELQG
ncbi:ABC-F family ATP-binding cassette domain-containing protein [Curvivirga aplysinae]|uniref:ABC-F family ATP-binding cassette domain-containing protein n=1 Tax=Curvivirga aplysinae TaxID=2529852 RepID=UPI0012BC37B1|nr:ATP-binding cassette domain-containing protein [Curvivirga aplysinae]MTI08457.1 ATP-binding cassette domain-containing protein [Curvivirga aplysinae]